MFVSVSAVITKIKKCQLFKYISIMSLSNLTKLISKIIRCNFVKYNNLFCVIKCLVVKD